MTSSPFAFLRRWDLRAPLTALKTNRRGDWAALTLASGDIAFLPTEDAGESPVFLGLHAGSLTALEPDADDHAFLVGGEEGQLFLVEPGVAAPTPLAQESSVPLKALAATPSGWRVFADSSRLHFLDETGEALCLPSLPTTEAHKLSFAPNGKSLVLGDALGWRLFDFSDPKAPRTLIEKNDLALDFVWSADSETLFLLTAEHHLQFWSLPDHGHPGLVGVLPLDPAAHRPSFLALTAEDKFLLAGGAPQVYALPLQGIAPWQNAPLHLGDATGAPLICVAPNPKENMVALGGEDGSILLAPLDGRREIPVFPPVAKNGAKVIGLGWSARGDSFLAALEPGLVLLFTQQSVARFVRNGMT